MSHLVEHGHTRIGLLIGELGTGDTREHGWREALHAAGLPEGPVAQVSWTREGGLEGGLHLLSAPDRPTAVFASSDLLAVGLLRAARELGLRGPGGRGRRLLRRDQGVGVRRPPLTVVRQDIEAMAEKAVALLLDREPSRPRPRHSDTGWSSASPAAAARPTAETVPDPPADALEEETVPDLPNTVRPSAAPTGSASCST